MASLEKQISLGIMEAMKAKDHVRLSALRNIKKCIIEAKTSGTAVDELPDVDVIKINSPSREQTLPSCTSRRTVRIWLMRNSGRWLSCRSICPNR